LQFTEDKYNLLLGIVLEARNKSNYSTLTALIVLSFVFSPNSLAAEMVAETNRAPTTNSEEAIKAPEVEVRSQRFRVITPLPGLFIDRSQSTTNIQSATGKELAESQAINVTEFMNSNMQSVSISDYAGNPFQQDLNYRGFTASPAIGTPQGISVYLDGVRINEPFGEVVNWDLIPMNALASLDLIPGSNPMFGLNTLGGALALRTKTGFTDAHSRGQLLTGAWGRQQVQVSNGVNNGVFGLFTAYNHFKEDGWRDHSPSNVRQIYNNATLKLPLGEINLSALNVNTHLTGNGLQPFESAAINREAVFTSPDEVKNSLEHYNLNGRLDITDYMSISALAYKRKVHQSAISGDLFEPYQRLLSALGGNDLNGDGIDDAERLNGMFNLSDLNQGSKGWALQTTIEKGNHQIAMGLTFDTNDIKFLQSQLLAEINANHEVIYATDPVYQDLGVDVVNKPVIRNNLKGGSTTKSIFFSDTWSPFDTLHITYGGRFNWTNVLNSLISDRGKELYNFVPVDFSPARNRCRIAPGDFTARFICTQGDYDYRSFNPALGIAWEIQANVTAYGNISRGARTPSVIELGCARDHTIDNQAVSTNFQYGCSIPTSLSADPYLKQVRSTAYETGLRGNTNDFNWNIGIFRTELKDDILFVPLGRRNRGLFDNFGETLRQGIEMGMNGSVGKSKLRLNYTYMKATFESPAQIINGNNSSNTATTTLQSFVNIQPGDELPGMPRQILQASWNYSFTDKFDMTLSMITHSSSYVRGNENNEHEARPASNIVAGGLNRDPLDYIGSGKISGYSVFNLRANYKLDHGVTIFTKIDNLFNKNYSTAGDLGLNGFNANGMFLTDTTQWKNTTFIGPAAPFAVWVGLSIDLDWKNITARK